jgi:hypothetical protein
LTGIGDVEIDVVSIGDSYTAYSFNSGHVVNLCSVIAPGWTGVRFFRMPAGQCGTGSVWNGWTLGAGNYVQGYTTEGVFRDRLNLAGITYDRAHKHEGAIGGTKAGTWSILPGEPSYPGFWDPVEDTIANPPTGRVLVVCTFGANDVLAYAEGLPFSDTVNWNIAQANIRGWILKILTHIFTLNPDAEVLLPGYVNFWIDDAPLVPGGPGNTNCALGPCTKPYPPTSNSQAVHRAVMSTSSFGFAKQSLGSGGYNGVDLTDTWTALTNRQYLALYGPPINTSDPRWGIIHDSGPPFCGTCYNPALWQLAGQAWPGYSKNVVDDGAFRNMTDDNVNQFFKGLLGPIMAEMDTLFDRVYYVPSTWSMFTAPGDGPYRSGRSKNTATTDGIFADFVHLSKPATEAYCDAVIGSWLIRTTFIEDRVGLVNFGAGDDVVNFSERFATDVGDEAAWAEVEALGYVRAIPRRAAYPLIEPPAWA